MGNRFSYVPGFEGLYSINENGEVFNERTGKKLKPYSNSDGYKYVKLCDRGRKKCFRVHRLVAEAFVPNPNNKRYVNHVDHDKTNNKAENLEWVTAQENTDHEIRKPGQRTRISHLKSNNKYRSGKVQLTFLVTKEEHDALMDIAEKTGMSRTRVIRLALHKYLKEGGNADA